MPKTLVFHTLQNSRHDFSKSHSDPSQPDLLGIVAILVDDDGASHGYMRDLVLLDEGKSVTQEQTRADGITTEMMLDDGKPLPNVLQAFSDLASQADRVAAYSIEHHVKVIQVAAEMAGVHMPVVSMMCIMKRATIPCGLPTRNPGVFKMPKLTEAYRHFAGTPFEIPSDGTPDEILNYHLHARLVIFEGIMAYERGELAKAAKPLVADWE